MPLPRVLKERNQHTSSSPRPPICFLAKPFAAAALIKCLETALEGRRGEANM
jgi:hypothetical protein